MNKEKDVVFPELNQRIKKLVDEFAGGNVAEFVRLAKISSHQVLNRIFSIDGRTGKYPKPSADILGNIKMNIAQVNCDWLLTGEGEMIKKPEPPTEAPAMNDADFITMPRSVWKVIEDQAASLRAKDESLRIKDEQVSEVIAMLKEQIKKGDGVDGNGHVAPVAAQG